MKSHLFASPARWLATPALMVLTHTVAFAQSGQISGRVTDAKGAPQVGATVVVTETKAGVSTNSDGTFTISNVPDGSYTLNISFIGALPQTRRVTVPSAGAQTLAISLQDDTKNLDEVIVTGVFDTRTKMESSVAITTLNARQIERLVPQSAADLLRNVPGVYVNSALGEVKNTVYSRGVSANSVGSLAAPANGYYYVSLQEDGLPVTGLSSGTISPDYFFRNDVTIARLEAVRGGTSSITSANAPGGIFNFLSKTGSNGPENEVRTRFGLEGNGRQPYYRADLNLGNKLNETGLSYNVGGFYRYANGARYAGYPFNFGGQVKGSVTQNFAKGTLRVYGKYLNDHNGSTVPLVGQGFNDDIRLAPGVKKSDSYLLPGVKTRVPNGNDTDLIDFDPRNLSHSRDITGGLSFTYDLSDTWSISNNGKYSRKNLEQDINVATNFTYLTDVVTGVFSGTTPLGPGIVTYKDQGTGAIRAQVQQNFVPVPGAPAGTFAPRFVVLNSDLPNAVQDAVRYNGSLKSDIQLDEFIDQFAISKKLGNGSVSAGLFYAHSRLEGTEMQASVLGLTPVEDRAKLLDVTFVPSVGPRAGQTFQISEPGTGYLKLGGSFGYGRYEYTNDQIAGFVGNNLNFGDKLNFDWGVRYEHIRIDGVNRRTVPSTKPGGIDGDPLTVYDNFYGVLGQRDVRFNKQLNTLSYSAGLNFKITENNAVYVRGTRGQKSPDVSFFQNYTTDFAVENDPLKQDITQFEVGYKLNAKTLSLVVTPFYSLLSNVGTTLIANDENNQNYYTPVLYNKVRTLGVEVEANYDPFKFLNVRGAFTVQSAKYPSWRAWNVGINGRADDVVVDFSGNKAENNPSLIINVTPTYSIGKFYALVQWSYLGERPANQPNAYNLPGFSQFDGSVGYEATKKLSFALNINNFTNTLGIMGSASPGTVVESFSPQNLTKAQVEANPNAVHSIIPIQPRAYFLSAVYKF